MQSGKVYKVEKVRSTFHDYLNFCGEEKDDRLFTIYDFTRRNAGFQHREIAYALVKKVPLFKGCFQLIFSGHSPSLQCS